MRWAEPPPPPPGTVGGALLEPTATATAHRGGRRAAAADADAPGDAGQLGGWAVNEIPSQLYKRGTVLTDLSSWYHCTAVSVVDQCSLHGLACRLRECSYVAYM
jgi:hypothetical protein